MASDVRPANSLSVTEVELEQYDVFLCHRGPDTKYGFVSYLYDRLEAAGLRSFLDCKSIGKGQDSQACMDHAVKSTPIALIVFSEKFADSEWCLNELKVMLDTPSVKVLPVFYKVQPDEVCFREESAEFVELTLKYNETSIGRWRDALKRASGLNGWVHEAAGQSLEADLVTAIVREVSELANKPLPLDVGDYVFGTKNVVDEIIQKHMEVSILVLWGMGGIGKSTLALELYNRLRETFAASCYVDLKSYCNDVGDSKKKVIRDKDIVEVQKHILKYLCPNGGNWELENKYKGKAILEERLSKKRILVVLDDVPDSCELCYWISSKMFTIGSMFIVTSRDRRVVEELSNFDMEKDVHFHNVQGLGNEDSQYVFASFAFDGHWKVKTGFEELVAKISRACGGVPLVLKVCGALLKGRKDAGFWKEVLKKLNSGTFDVRGRILECLKISFDALDQDYQDMFLDITCALLGKPKYMAIPAWTSHGWYPIQGIEILVERALVTVDDSNCFRMHDHLRDMGRQILKEQRSKGVITRLSMPESLEYFRQNEGFPESLEILIYFNTVDSSLPALDISHMKKLRILMCDDTITATTIPKSLCWWTLFVPWFKNWDYQLKCIITKQVITTLPKVPLPNNKLVVLSLARWRIEMLPDIVVRLEKLEVLNLRECSKLCLLPNSFVGLRKLRDLNLEGSGITSLPESFGELSNLEVLNLRKCLELCLLPDSFGGLRKLRDLNLEGSGITSLPEAFGELSNLEVLNVEGCKKLHLLPESSGGLRKLRDLNLEGSGITSLPASFGELSSLEVLNLRGCEKLLLLPGSLTGLKNVKSFGYSGSAFASLLQTMGCLKDFEESSLSSKLNTLQNLLGIMKTRKELVLEDFAIEALPESFGELGNLEVLNLRGCSNLRLLPDSFGGLSKLRDLNLEGSGITSLPASFGDLSSLEVLNLRGCEKLHLLPESFGGLRKLRDLNLGHCRITDSFGDLSSLKDLNLSLRDYCGIRSLPASFGELSSLEVLNAEGCKMLHLLPDSLVGLRKLRDLNLEGSGITSLPESFGELSNLEVLNLRKCLELCLLPDSFGGLRKLRDLNLEGSGITSLPEAFGELSNLEVLNVEGCKKLHLLPESSGGLRKLRDLNLEGSGITSLPASFGELSSLEVLNLRGCEKLLLLPGSLTGLKNVKSFGYSGSAFASLLQTMGCLKDFEESSLSSKLNTLQNLLGIMKTRKELVLEDFAIEALPESFGELGNLEVLNLRGCSNLRLLPDSFGGLRKLRDLNLEGSGITSLPASFGELSNLEVLNLWQCPGLRSLPKSFGRLKKLRNRNEIGRLVAVNEVQYHWYLM